MTIRLPVVGSLPAPEKVVTPLPSDERRAMPIGALFVLHSAGDRAAQVTAAQVGEWMQEAGHRVGVFVAKEKAASGTHDPAAGFATQVTRLGGGSFVGSFDDFDFVIGAGHELPGTWKPLLTVAVTPERSRAEWKPTTRSVADRIDVLMPRARPELFRQLAEMLVAA